MSKEPGAPPVPADEAATPPSSVRYGVLGFLCALTFVLYLDRVCIAQAVPVMQKALDLSNTEMGYVLAAFTVAYGLFEVPTGRWGDRFGSRGVLTRIVLWWSAFTALTGCVWRFRLESGLRIGGWAIAFDSLLLLILIRFLFGAGEAGALPNTARVLSRWFPPSRRGRAQGVVTAAALVGGAAAPVVAAKLIEFLSWRLTFVIFGSLGVVWAAAFYAWFRDDPAKHPAINKAELLLIRDGAPPAGHGEHPPVPWALVLRCPNVWLLGGTVTCAAFATYMYFSWYPKYLQSARGVKAEDSGWLASLVLAGGAVGCTLGGYLCDWLVRRTGDRTRLRFVGSAGLGLAALCLLASLWCESPVLAATLTAGACLANHVHVASWWASVTAISGRHLGALFGLMNSLGVPGAVASQLFFGWFADRMAKLYGYAGRAQWDPGFYIYAGVLTLGALAWLFVDVSRPVEPGEGEG